jgi:serpin B
VDVHEEGTEAAAATAAIVGTYSLPPPLPKATVHANRPFVFLIRESRTGGILFAGRVMDPTK